MLGTGCWPSTMGYWQQCTFDKATYSGRLATLEHFDRHRPFYALGPDYGVVVFDVPQMPLRDDVRGLQVTAWGAHAAHVPRATRPEGLLAELLARHPVPQMERQSGYQVEDADSLRGTHRALLDGLARRGDLLVDLWRRAPAGRPWDLFFGAVAETHTAGHAFWPHPHVRAAVEEAGTEALLHDVYREVDGLVGRLLVEAGPDAQVLIFSVEGMRGNNMDNGSMLFLPDLLVRYSFGASGIRLRGPACPRATDGGPRRLVRRGLAASRPAGAARRVAAPAARSGPRRGVGDAARARAGSVPGLARRGALPALHLVLALLPPHAGLRAAGLLGRLRPRERPGPRAGRPGLAPRVRARLRRDHGDPPRARRRPRPRDRRRGDPDPPGLPRRWARWTAGGPGRAMEPPLRPGGLQPAPRALRAGRSDAARESQSGRVRARAGPGLRTGRDASRRARRGPRPDRAGHGRGLGSADGRAPPPRDRRPAGGPAVGASRGYRPAGAIPGPARGGPVRARRGGLHPGEPALPPCARSRAGLRLPRPLHGSHGRTGRRGPRRTAPHDLAGGAPRSTPPLETCRPRA